MRITVLLGVLILIGSCRSHHSDTTETQAKRKSPYANFKFESTEFESFYTKFISDSLFQISRIKFPIGGQIADYEGERNWEKNTWPMLKWNLREEIINTSDSLSIQQTDKKFFFGSYCLDCGFSFEMAFEKIKDEWYMTYRQENNF